MVEKCEIVSIGRENWNIRWLKMKVISDLILFVTSQCQFSKVNKEYHAYLAFQFFFAKSPRKINFFKLVHSLLFNFTAHSSRKKKFRQFAGLWINHTEIYGVKFFFHFLPANISDRHDGVVGLDHCKWTHNDALEALELWKNKSFWRGCERALAVWDDSEMWKLFDRFEWTQNGQSQSDFISCTNFSLPHSDIVCVYIGQIKFHIWSNLDKTKWKISFLFHIFPFFPFVDFPLIFLFILSASTSSLLINVGWKENFWANTAENFVSFLALFFAFSRAFWGER